MDRRLERRGHQILEGMIKKQSSISNRYCETATQEMGNRRFMKNERIEKEQIQEASYRVCREQTKGKHVVAIQDTTEVNYQSHAGRLSREDPELGPVGNNKDIGFFLHPVLAVDAVLRFPLGIASVYEWNRDWEKASKTERDYKNQRIEEKESFRWIASAHQAQEVLQEADHITVIGDRESDIYEELVMVPNAHCDVLIRSAKDRRLVGQEETLYSHLALCPCVGERTIELKGNKKRKDRQAQVEIRYSRVKIACPPNRSGRGLPPYVEVYAIEIREKASSVPDGEEPVLWRLLTTHETVTVEDAWQCAEWYACRWWIEEWFRVLKTQGLDVEAAQYESGLALKRLVLIALQAALQILQLTAARDGRYPIAPEALFTQEELEFQERLLPQVEGKTQKQMNPYPRSNLAWSAWLIARLGGWKKYYSKNSPPGPITMKRGLERFYLQFAGWCLATDSSP